MRGTKLSAEQAKFLQGRHFAMLATLNGNGTPQLTTVWYMLDHGRLIINTKRGRQKFVNMTRDRRVALLIDADYQYLTVSGTAREATERDPYKDIESLAIRYNGEAKGRRQARQQFSKEPRVSFEIVPARVLSGL